MKSGEKFDFEKFYEMDSMYINLSNPDLLNKCNITPIVGNKTGEDTVMLHYKNALQHKIISYQYEQFDKLCADKRLTKKEIQFINNLNYSDHGIIKRYSNLDLLSLLQDYKNKHPITTREKNMVATYTRKLYITTGIQRRILHAQQDQLLCLAKTFLNLSLPEQKSVVIEDTGLKAHIITDKHLISNVQLINTIQSKSDQLPDLKSDMCVMTINQFMDYTQQSTKISIPDDQSVSNDCCVCFENIEQKIGLIPCGHTTICEKCIPSLHDKQCPICRVSFTQCVKLFL